MKLTPENFSYQTFPNLQYTYHRLCTCIQLQRLMLTWFSATQLSMASLTRLALVKADTACWLIPTVTNILAKLCSKVRKMMQ